ncbi:hypothetical protein NE865_08732 [Phthorimaea operculella]|nr:hypothetical protein NE865_08732 [Phthorimaea operculella]
MDLLSTACHLEHSDCLENAVRMYTNWMLTPNPDAYNEIHADIRSTVYCVGVHAGGAREWNFAWERFKMASAPSERELLLSVLGCTRAPYLLYRYLELSLRNDSGIRKQDTVRVFGAVAGSAIGQPIAFSFVRANWAKLKELLYFAEVHLDESDRNILSFYLELSLRNDSGIRKQDTVRVFGAVAGSAIGQPIAFSFVRANWAKLKEFVGSTSTLNAIIKLVTRRLNQPHEFEELKRFIQEYCGDLGRPVQQALESTAANVQWMQQNYQTIVDWLLKAKNTTAA